VRKDRLLVGVRRIAAPFRSGAAEGQGQQIRKDRIVSSVLRGPGAVAARMAVSADVVVQEAANLHSHVFLQRV